MTVMWIRPTKETLAAMAKLIGQAGEAAKVKVRQARKSAVDGIKTIPSEDEQKRAEKHVSHMHQHHIVLQPLCCSISQHHSLLCLEVQATVSSHCCVGLLCMSIRLYTHLDGSRI